MLDRGIAERGLVLAGFVSLWILPLMNGNSEPAMEMKRAPDPLTLTERNDGDTIRVAPGSNLTLKLETVPGTGYAWELAAGVPGPLTLIGDATAESGAGDTADRPLGAAAVQTFGFHAEREGTSVLRLVYRRAWEADHPPLKTFTVTVKILRER